MKIKKFLPVAILGALLFSSCQWDGNNVDYNADSNLASSGNGSAPVSYVGASVSVDSRLKAGKLSQAEIVINSKAFLNEESVSKALKFYSVEANSVNAKYAPARTTEYSYTVAGIEAASNGTKNVTTTVTVTVDLTECKQDTIAWVLDAAQLKLKNNSMALNADLNGTAGEETDSYAGYITLDTAYVSNPTHFDFEYAENFCPLFEYGAVVNSVYDDQGVPTGEVKVIVYDANFADEIYANLPASTVSSIYSLNVKEPGSKAFRNVALNFTLDETNHIYTAVSSVFAEGTKAYLVTKHMNTVVAETAKSVYGHNARQSYYKQVYSTYDDMFTIGKPDFETSTIVSLSEYEAGVSGDAFDAQNSLLKSSKYYSYYFEDEDENDVKGGVIWTVELDSAYDSVATSFSSTDGFFITNSSNVKIPSVVNVIEKDENNFATKVEVTVSNKVQDCSTYSLWVNSNTKLSENKINEKQLCFGTTADSSLGAVSGAIQVADDAITGLDAGAGTYYTLRANNAGTQNNLTWTLNSGSASYVDIYRNNVKIATTSKTSYVDTGLNSGTKYTYQLKKYNSSCSNSFVVYTTPVNANARYCISIADNSIANSTGSYPSSYINISGELLPGKNSTSYSVYRTDVETGIEKKVSSYDYDVYPDTEYIYVLKDSNGKAISDELHYTTGAADYLIYFRPWTGNDNAYVYWTYVPGSFTYTNSEYSLYINDEKYALTSDCNYEYNSFNGVSNYWHYVYISLEAGNSYTFSLRDDRGVKLCEDKVLEVSDAYYSLAAKYEDKDYSKLELSWLPTYGTAGEVNLYRNDEFVATISDNNYYVDTTCEAGESYVYVLRDSSDFRVSPDYYVTVPSMINLDVKVLNTDGSVAKTEEIEIHAPGSGINDYMWNTELWVSLAAKDSSYSSENYYLYGDELLIYSVDSSNLYEGATLYLAGKNTYLIDGTVEVQDSYSENIDDFKLVSCKSTSMQYYSVALEKGNDYAVDFYNSNIKSNGTLYSDFTGKGSYNWNGAELYIYQMTSSGELKRITYTSSSARIIISAWESGNYIIGIKGTGSGYCAFRVFEDPCLTVKVAASSTEDAFEVKVPLFGNIYYSAGLNKYGSGSYYSSVSTVAGVANRAYSEDGYAMYYKYDYYSNSSYTNVASDSDVKLGAILYAKKSEIIAGSAKAQNFSEFAVYENKTGNSSHQYLISTEPGKSYTVELFNGYNASNYSFTDVPANKKFDNSSSKTYSLSDSVTGNLINVSSSNSKFSFIAFKEEYYLTVSADKNCATAVHVYESDVTVVVADGEEVTETNVPYGSNCFYSNDGKKYTEMTVTSVMDAVSYINSCKIAEVSSNSVFVYSDEANETRLAANTKVTAGATYYVVADILEISDGASNRAEEFSFYKYSDNNNYYHRVKLNVEKGKTYTVQVINGYNSGSYSDLPDEYEFSSSSYAVLSWKDAGAMEYQSVSGTSSSSYRNYSFDVPESLDRDYYLYIYTSSDENYGVGYRVYEVKNQVTIYGEEEFTVPYVKSASYFYYDETQYKQSSYSLTSLQGLIDHLDSRGYINKYKSFVYSDSECTQFVSVSDFTDNLGADDMLYIKPFDPVTVSDEVSYDANDYTLVTKKYMLADSAKYDINVEPGEVYTICLINSSNKSGFENLDESLSFYSTTTMYLKSGTTQIIGTSLSDKYISFKVPEDETNATYTLSINPGSYCVGFNVTTALRYTVKVDDVEEVRGYYKYYYKTDSGWTNSTLSNVSDLYTLKGKNKDYYSILNEEGSKIYPNNPFSPLCGYYYNLVESVIEVHDAAPTSYDDFEPCTYFDAGSSSHKYKLTLESGKTYDFSMLSSSNYKDYEFEEECSGKDYLTSSTNFKLFKVDEEDGETAISGTFSGKDFYFTADQSDYILQIAGMPSGSYWQAYYIYEVEEDAVACTVNVGSGEDSTDYTLFAGSGLYKVGDEYKTVTISSVSDVITALNSVYGLTLSTTGGCTLYKNEACTINATAADLKAGATLYVKPNTLAVKASAPASIDDFTVYSYKDGNSKTHRYYLNVEAGKTYSIALYSGKTASSYEFGDPDTSKVYYAKASWTLNKRGSTNELVSMNVNNEDYSVVNFIPDSTTYYLDVNTYAAGGDYSVGVCVYEAENVAAITVHIGEEEYDAVVGGRYALKNNSGNYELIDCSSIANLTSAINAVNGTTYNSQYYDFYTDSGKTTFAENSELTDGVEIYGAESTLKLVHGTPSATADYSLLKQERLNDTLHYYKLNTVVGKDYVLYLVNSSNKSSSCFSSDSNSWSSSAKWALYEVNEETGLAKSEYIFQNSSYSPVHFTAEKTEYYVRLDTYSSGSYRVAVSASDSETLDEYCTCKFVEDGAVAGEYKLFNSYNLIKNGSSYSVVSAQKSNIISIINANYGTSYNAKNIEFYTDEALSTPVGSSITSPLYMKSSVMTAGNTLPDAYAAYTEYTYNEWPSGGSHYYKLNLTAGNSYKINLYNGNTTDYTYADLPSSGTYTTTSKWSLIKRNGNSEGTKVYSNSTEKEINFVAEQDDYYLELYTSASDEKVGACVTEIEADHLTITVSKDGVTSEDYTVNTGNWIAGSGSTYSVLNINTIENAYSYLNSNFNAGLSTYTYTLYKDEEKTEAAADSDVVANAHLYAYGRELTVGTKATSFADFTYYKYEDSDSQYSYYGLSTEPGTLYYIELYNGTSAGSYDFEDVPEDGTFANGACYSITDLNGNTIISASSSAGGSVLKFYATESSYIVKLDTNTTTAKSGVAVNVYEIENYYTVMTKIFGSSAYIPVKVPAESSLSILTAPSAYRSTLTSKSMLSVDNLRAYYLPFNAIDSSNVASYRVFSDAAMTVEATDADLVAGATLYADNRVRIGTKTTPSVADCTIVCLNPTKSSGYFTMDFEIEVEAGKSYKVIIVDSYSTNFSDYSSYHDTYTYVYADGSQVAHNDDNSFTFNVSSDNEKTYKITVKNRSGESGFCGFYIYKTN